jgi:cysteine synthase A
VTLICDSGERYSNTYFNKQWLSQQGLDVDSAEIRLEELVAGQRPPDVSCLAP